MEFWKESALALVAGCGVWGSPALDQLVLLPSRDAVVGIYGPALGILAFPKNYDPVDPNRLETRPVLTKASIDDPMVGPKVEFLSIHLFQLGVRQIHRGSRERNANCNRCHEVINIGRYGEYWHLVLISYFVKERGRNVGRRGLAGIDEKAAASNLA